MEKGGWLKYIKFKIKKVSCLLKGVGEFKDGSYVSAFADLRRPGRICLGEGTVLEKHARLYAIGKEARILIGDYSTVYPYALLKANGGVIEIGKQCSLNDYVILNGFGGIRIGNGVHIASQSVIVAAEHRFERMGTPYFSTDMQGKGIKIEDNVWIGSGAVILDGVTIGTKSVIGAGAVVTKDIPPYSLAVGVPARVIKKLN